MFASTLETIASTESKRVAYTRGLLAILAVAIAVKAVWFSGFGLGHARELVDFDAFYIAAKQVWLGGLDQVYDFTKLIVLQREASGGQDGLMPWTYPPQFSLLLAPLAWLPLGIANLLFTTFTAALFLFVLRRLAGSHFVILLIVLFPTMAITVSCGQNGFLTAGLIGMVCLFFEERPVFAGLALGLMIVKPHLAVAFAIYAVLRRSWTMVATAAAVVLASSAACTAIFGIHIWTAFLQSVRDSSIFLEQGYYPMSRMVSTYTALRAAGLSASISFWGQGVVAVLAIGIVIFAAYRMRAREGLGLTAVVSICISPYAYDYDFLIFGIGLALLLPAFLATANEWERGIIYAAPIPIGAYAYLRATLMGSSNPNAASIGGFAIVLLIILMLAILRRSWKAETTPSLSKQRPLAHV